MFDEDRLKRIAAKALAAQEAKKKDWNTKSIKEKFDEVVIGNEDYKQKLAIVLSGYLSEKKSREHVLVFGPSGTGKTYMIEQTFPEIDLPYIVIDAPGLSPNAYDGNTLSKSLKAFFRDNPSASERGIIVLDEFDKLSTKGGGDEFKSQGIQSELLTLIQGKQEAGIDTRNSLWILLGAFAYADQMKTSPPELTKSDLLQYGFKNELLGRIAVTCMTESPTMEQLLARIAYSKEMMNLFEHLKLDGFDLRPDGFEDDALLELTKIVLDDRVVGMRKVKEVVAKLKLAIVFDKTGKFIPGQQIRISGETIRALKEK